MPDLTLLSSIDKQKESLGVTIEKEPVSVKRSVRKLFEFLVVTLRPRTSCKGTKKLLLIWQKVGQLVGRMIRYYLKGFLKPPERINIIEPAGAKE